MDEEEEIQLKKPVYLIKAHLREHLKQYSRLDQLPISYDDLLHFSESLPHVDAAGNNTLWFTVLYDRSYSDEIQSGLVRIYEKLINEGGIVPYLKIERVDFCTFGNSKPFRIMVTNEINDNYDYFYIKRADASRIYGLELEEIFSPDKVNYIVDGQTLVEEHVIGIPVDEFILKHEGVKIENRMRFAKEFVKFNERSFVRLLGDMRAYNFVVEVTQDFDNIQYRLRAMDFDQQCYEGKMNMYKPQFYKDNLALVTLVQEMMSKTMADQYQKEERVAMKKRFLTSRQRTRSLIRKMNRDRLSSPEKITELKTALAAYHKQPAFMNLRKMGDVLNLHLECSLDINVISKPVKNEGV